MGELAVCSAPYDLPEGCACGYLSGFYLLDAGSLDEVIALAKQLPEVAAGHSGVEIRPVVDHG